jgi:hypothetical protein
MFCAVKGCIKLATYLIILGDIRFSVCEEHNKVKWALKKPSRIETKEKKDESN